MNPLIIRKENVNTNYYYSSSNIQTSPNTRGRHGPSPLRQHTSIDDISTVASSRMERAGHNARKGERKKRHYVRKGTAVVLRKLKGSGGKGWKRLKGNPKSTLPRGRKVMMQLRSGDDLEIRHTPKMTVLRQFYGDDNEEEPNGYEGDNEENTTIIGGGIFLDGHGGEGMRRVHYEEEDEVDDGWETLSNESQDTAAAVEGGYKDVALVQENRETDGGGLKTRMFPRKTAGRRRIKRGGMWNSKDKDGDTCLAKGLSWLFNRKTLVDISEEDEDTSGIPGCLCC